MFAAQYFPTAIAQLETQQQQLKQERETHEAKAKREAAVLTKQEQRVNRISKRLLNENRRVWAIRIWAIKELSANALVVLLILLMGGAIGFVAGVNQPDGVVCRKSGLCDRLRIQDRKLTY